MMRWRICGSTVALVITLAGIYFLQRYQKSATIADAGKGAPVLEWPGSEWTHKSPEETGTHAESLGNLAKLVEGSGFISRHGYEIYSWGEYKKQRYIASAMKPVISTLLLCAVQEGKLKGVDDTVATVQPGLAAINGGKDLSMTWRHLACMVSGYGLVEPPGAAWAYNDFAIALYYDTLVEKVFQEDGTDVLHSRLSGPLGFQDKSSFASTGVQGKLGLSARDLARYGLCILRRGKWRDKQIIQEDLLGEMLHSPVPADIPAASGQEAAMLPDQRSIGGGKNDCLPGQGIYSFNWWLNTPGPGGRRPLAAAPPDTILASGLWGKHTLWVIPSMDLIVVWNSSPILDQRESVNAADTKFNAAAKLIRECADSLP